MAIWECSLSRESRDFQLSGSFTMLRGMIVRDHWRAALYAHLSREDGDKGESNSIATQKTILEEYIARDPTLSCAGVYVDYGCTGTNFDRPGFQRITENSNFE